MRPPVRDDVGQQTDLLARLCAARTLEAERRVDATVGGLACTAFLDVVATEDAGTLVVDWKAVEAPTSNYGFQLDTYALLTADALHRPRGSVETAEVNLLSGAIHHRHPDASELGIVEDRIWASARMLGALVDDHRQANLEEAADVDVARSPRSCEWCPFLELCLKVPAARQRSVTPIQGALL